MQLQVYDLPVLDLQKTMSYSLWTYYRNTGPAQTVQVQEMDQLHPFVILYSKKLRIFLLI